MKNQTFIFFVLAVTLAGCTSQPKISINFNLTTDSNKKSLHVNFRNNSNTDLMVLSMGRVAKVGSKHPCGAIRLDDFTKISSHREGDCNINLGSKLFVYQKIIPFSKIDYLNFRNELTKRDWFKDRYELFTYMDPLKHDNNTFPAFILLKAGETTVVEYAIDSNLSKIDRGAYRISWANKEEIDKILSPKNENRYKLREAITDTKLYKYYDGPLAVEPLILNL